MAAGARDHGRLPCKIWNDKTFRALPRTAQALYAQLSSDTAVNNAGILPLQVAKWAAGCVETTEREIEDDLGALSRAGYVVVDTDTYEVLLRSHLRDDGLLKHKYIFTNALRCAEAASSDQIRKALAIELYKLNRADATAVADELAGAEPDPDPDEMGFESDPDPIPMPSESHSDPTPSDHRESHPNAIPMPSQSDPDPTPFGPPQGMASESHPDHWGEGEGVGVISSSEVGYVKNSFSSAKPPTPEKKLEPYREDVEALCTRLRDLIVANGSRATITNKWRTEARLMLDRDERDFSKAMNLIEWCQSDSFWKANILSMPKFRAQYDALRLQAIRQHEERPRALSVVNGGLSRADEKVQGYLAIGARLSNPTGQKELG